MLVVFAIAAVCLSPPVEGPVITGFGPVGQYGGHWGVDYAARVGEQVRAPASGRVTFAGSVAGMRTLTIEPVVGFKISLSYLATVGVSSGGYVRRGQVVGSAGAPHGVPGVHLSTRIDGRYVDPAGWMGCRETDITRALRLVTPPQPYSRRRANRNPRRDIRPDPRCPSSQCRVCPPSGPARPGPDHARRGSLAEVRT
jgi:murein DD-endopeptidase MepM/ murein hydrolase activator NlpD